MNNIDDDWQSFIDGSYVHEDNRTTIEINENLPKSSSLYISTKTIISYLSSEISLKDLFWKLHVMEYKSPCEGIVKKQMKFNSYHIYELEQIKEHILKYKNEGKLFIEDQTMDIKKNNIGNNDNFKDIRKISVGLCKKDIVSYKSKKKGAFYNCFVLVLRILNENKFKEIHIKVFNTGKLEIPGIQQDNILKKVLELLTNIIRNTCEKYNNIKYLENKTETVLINSNFNCGYLINRNKMLEILKYKYNINTSYDSCSYPGIQCQFFYNKNSDLQDGKQNNSIESIKVSFMIFRTGSVLIVGKCSEYILNKIYIFIKNVLETEYANVSDGLLDHNKQSKKMEKKIRKKIIYVNTK